MTENKPYKKFRAGQVSATIWNNEQTNKEGKTFEVKTIQLTKSYTTDEGKTWKDTNSFSLNDLPKIQLVILKAQEELLLSKE